MGPIKCEILLSKLSKIYFSSEIVLGTVCLTAKAATNISTLELCLIGEGKFGSEETFQVFKESKLIQFHKILPSGVQCFPISWPLPLDLAPTGKWNSGSVNYRFESRVGIMRRDGRKEEWNSGLSVPIQIMNLIDLNTLPHPFTSASEHKATYFQPHTGNILLRFVLNRKCFIPGEFLKFHCDLYSTNTNSNQHRRILKGLSVALQEVVFYNDGIRNGSESVRTTIWEKVGFSNGTRSQGTSHFSSEWEDSIKITNSCNSTPIDLHSSGAVRVHYLLHVRVSLKFVGGRGLRMGEQSTLFSIPIVMGSIPLESPLVNEVLMALIIARRITTFDTFLPGATRDSGIWHICSSDGDTFGGGMANGNVTGEQFEFLENRPDLETPPPPYEEAILMGNESDETEPPDYATASLNAEISKIA